MAKRGKKFTLYGAFESKAEARREEKRHSGSFILDRKIKGHLRHIVLKPRKS